MHSTRKVAVAVGLDVGDRMTQVYIVDANAEVLEEARIRTTPAAFQSRFSTMKPARIALEVGPHSPWIERLLLQFGHEVLVANARRLRMIADSDRKTDRTDAEWLARLALFDPRLLAPVQHRKEQMQADMAVLRARAVAVTARTKLVNHVRGCVKSFGVQLPRTTTHGFAKTVPSSIPQELRPALDPVLALIGQLTTKINSYEKRIEELCEQHYPVTELLREVTGVGPITALAYVLTIQDPTRFRSSRSVGCYLGLTCRKRQSGERDPELRITKAGDRFLRCLLVQAAHYILGPFGPDSDLQRWGLKLAARGRRNAKKRALVAVARKLAVLLHRLWATGMVYEPLRDALTKQQARVTA